MSETDIRIPGYLAGTWDIDPVHSDVAFSVRHMMVSKVRGRFNRFQGEIVTASDPLLSSVTAAVDLRSLDTNNEQRDADLLSSNFLDVDTYPTMTYRSTGVKPEGDHYVVEGLLTLRGVTRAVPLSVELNGFGPDAFGGIRAGWTARTEIDRRDFGVETNIPLDGGGMVIGDKVEVTIEVEAVLREAAAEASTPD
jgi:polyisoprenoid-binding protein YceI